MQAELQTKLKLDKTSDIKAIQSEIATLRSDISKNEDTLKECHTFREFLDGLAPDAWLKEQKAKFKRNTRTRLRRSLASIANGRASTAAAAAVAASSGEAEAGSDSEIVMHEDESGMRLPRRRASVVVKPRGTVVRIGGSLVPSPANPSADPELEDIDAWEPELFFAEPKQLLDIYAELEAGELFHHCCCNRFAKRKMWHVAGTRLWFCFDLLSLLLVLVVGHSAFFRFHFLGRWQRHGTTTAVLSLRIPPLRATLVSKTDPYLRRSMQFSR
jgi:hypothetical protein